jgi:hypothetical protein
MCGLEKNKFWLNTAYYLPTAGYQSRPVRHARYPLILFLLDISKNITINILSFSPALLYVDGD